MTEQIYVSRQIRYIVHIIDHFVDVILYRCFTLTQQLCYCVSSTIKV